MKVTETLLDYGKSIRGSWSNKQLRVLGLKEPYITKRGMLKKGWKQWLLGTEITEQQYKAFIELKDKHLDKLGNNLFDQYKSTEIGLEHMNSIKEELKCSNCIHKKTKNCFDNVTCKSYFDMKVF